MNALITSAKIIDDSSKHHNKTVCIRIKNGIIDEIAATLEPIKDEKVISFENLSVSQGWFDSSVSMGEPGFEERETIKNGLQVAAKSGFTGIALNANTDPIIDTNSGISYLKNRAQAHAIDLFPIGALTRKSEGIDLAELYDMHQAGAIAFSDYQKSVQHPNLLKLALQYTQGFDGLVMSFPQEKDLVGKGIVNEGIVSTNLGLKGIPVLAETLQISRDLHILEYTGGKLHIPTISSAQSVELIKNAKEKGLNVTCSVAIANLFFTDEMLSEFDTHFKMTPPLRNEADREALIAGVKDGTIDMVCSDHNPLDIEKKKIEFDYAYNGTLAQEAIYGALITLVSESKAIKLLTNGRKRFTQALAPIESGNEANLTLFSAKGSYVFTEKDILSKSKNAAFLGQKLKGRVYGILANNQFIES
ncbi:MAG: dihydroorotase [Leeuwenhoekiella sp.]